MHDGANGERTAVTRETTLDALRSTLARAADRSRTPTLVADRRGRVLFANDAVRRFSPSQSTGPIDLGGQTLASALGLDIAQTRVIRSLLRIGETGSLPIQVEGDEPGVRNAIATLSPAYTADGDLAFFVVQVIDVSALRDAETALKREVARLNWERWHLHRALHRVTAAHAQAVRDAKLDALTGLVCRSAFREAFTAAMAQPRPEDQVLALLVIDVDNFKTVNDSFGHPAGDRVLRAVADVIDSSIRSTDIAARYGGDEFAVMVAVDTPFEAARVAERIASGVRKIVFDGHAVSVSVGYDFAAPSETDLDVVIERADAALYRAKRAGRDQIQAS